MKLTTVKNKVKPRYTEFIEQEHIKTGIGVDRNGEEIEDSTTMAVVDLEPEADDFMSDIPEDMFEKGILKEKKEALEKAMEEALERGEQEQVEPKEENSGLTIEEEQRGKEIPAKQVPDDYFEVGDKAEVIDRGGIVEFKIGDILTVSKALNGNIEMFKELEGTLGENHYGFNNRWYKKVSSNKQQETPQEAQNKPEQKENKKDGVSCTQAERDFLDSFLELQTAGAFLGLVATGNHIAGTGQKNLLFVPRINEITELDKHIAFELDDSKHKEVYKLVSEKIAEVLEKLSKVYLEQEDIKKEIPQKLEANVIEKNSGDWEIFSF